MEKICSESAACGKPKACSKPKVYNKPKVCYTYDDYGRLEDACAGCSYETDWFPAMEDIENFILPDPVRFIPFIVWLLGSGHMARRKRTLTESQQEARKCLYQILYDCVELVDA